MRRIITIFIVAILLVFTPMYFLALKNDDSAPHDFKPNRYVHSHKSDGHQISQTYIKTFDRYPPLGFELWVEFAKENKCELNFSYYEQIYLDLDPWMNGKLSTNISEYYSGAKRFAGSLTLRDFKFRTKSFSDNTKLFNSVAHLLKYDFQYLISGYDEPISLPADDSLPYQSIEDLVNRSSCIRNISKEILNSHGFFLGPDSFVSVNSLLPVFSQTKHYCYKDVVVPMSYHIGFSQESITDNVPWNEKKKVLFWRGSTTGGSNRLGKPWEKYHRVRLLDWEKKWSERHPQSVIDTGKMSEDLKELVEYNLDNTPKLFVDIGFSGYCQMDDATKEIFQTKYPLKSTVSFVKTTKFKYLLVIDGNTWPSRIQKYLATNSVILYNGIFTDLYLGMLKPWVHYVPIRTDLSDLDEKIEWLLANDDEAHSIAINAKALMSTLGRYEHLQCYTGLLLQEYGRIFGQKGK